MNTGLLIIEVALLVGLAAGTHLLVARNRWNLVAGWDEEIDGRTVRAAAAVVDLVVALIYGAFILAVVPVQRSVIAAQSIDEVFDIAAFFAILLAILHVLGLVSLRGIVKALEGPWTPPAEQPSWA